ncbi:MAG: hypothetical protein AB1726_03445 [Planctomycetota bacterium]
MRPAAFALLTILPLAPLALHFPQEEKPARRNPLTAFQEDESARIDRELQGAWVLMEYKHPDILVPPEDARGFLLVHDGFLALSLQGREDRPGYFRMRREYTVQAGGYRYQILDGLHLQTAGLVGFSNANADGELDFRTALAPTEYLVTVAGDELTLVSLDHRAFRFRRLERSALPSQTTDLLNRLRAGGEVGD